MANIESVRRLPRDVCNGIHHKHKLGEREREEIPKRAKQFVGVR